MKKVNKNSLSLWENNLPLWCLLCGQTASSLRPYGCNGHIICIGVFSLLGKSYNKHYGKTTYHYGVFFVIKQPLAYVLTGGMVRSYV
jgi:hypothetical protein